MKIGVILDGSALVADGGGAAGIEVKLAADRLAEIPFAVTAGEKIRVFVLPVTRYTRFTFSVDACFGIRLARMVAAATVFVVIPAISFASGRRIAVQVIRIADGNDAFAIDAGNVAVGRADRRFSVKDVVTIVAKLSAVQRIRIEVDVAAIHELMVGIRPSLRASVTRRIEMEKFLIERTAVRQHVVRITESGGACLTVLR